MQETKDTAARDILLNCLEGRPAPPVVIQGWKTLSTFPESALSPFWISLAPVLVKPDHTDSQELIPLFCKEHDIMPEKALAAMGCCELLLRQAAALDLPDDAFRQDLETLSQGRSGHLVNFILECYPDARQTLRQQILMETLATHGKLMTGLKWRVDKVQHSSQGNHLNTDIALLTLEYREGQRRDQITLQLTQEAARKLSDFCQRLNRKS